MPEREVFMNDSADVTAQVTVDPLVAARNLAALIRDPAPPRRTGIKIIFQRRKTAPVDPEFAEGVQQALDNVTAAIARAADKRRLEDGEQIQQQKEGIE